MRLFTYKTCDLHTVPLICKYRGHTLTNTQGNSWEFNADNLVHNRSPPFTTLSVTTPPTKHLCFFLTDKLQGPALLPPVHDGLQLFLDALWGDLPSHSHRGGCVRGGATPALVLPSWLGYVFHTIGLWARSTWIHTCIAFFGSWFQEAQSASQSLAEPLSRVSVRSSVLTSSEAHWWNFLHKCFRSVYLSN